MGHEGRSSPGRQKFARISDGRDEFNLAEFPLTVLADKTPPGVKTVEWEDEIVDKSTGLQIKRKVIVTGSDAYGLPTAPDADVLFALVQLTKQVNDFSSRDVSFSRYELLQVLGWRDEGKSYRRIEESLNRWVGTSVYFSAWRDKETETWQSEKFHVLDNVRLTGGLGRPGARGGPGPATSLISWNRVVFRNLQAGFVCPVDLGLYFSLRRAASKRIFRYLGKHFRLRQQEVICFDLKHFAFEKVGLSRSYGDCGLIKRELRPALEELEAVGFLRPMAREERYTKVARGEWTITLARAAPPCPVPPAGEAVGAVGAGPRPLERELIARGVSPATAAELVGGFDPDRVARQVEALDWLVARKDRRVSKSAAGYLVQSIRRGYAPPQGFVPEAGRAAAPGAEVEAGQRGAADEARRRGDEAEAEREAADEARVRAYWEALTPGEQEAHREAAVREGNAFLAAQYRRTRGTKPEAEAAYLKALLDEHVRRILDRPAGPAAPAPDPGEGFALDDAPPPRPPAARRVSPRRAARGQ